MQGLGFLRTFGPSSGFKEKSVGISGSVVGGRLPHGSPGLSRLNSLQGSFTGSSKRV